jgi:hypothetical protein
MEDQKEVKSKIKRLKKIIIHQMKNSTWNAGYQSQFRNDIVEFTKSNSGWRFKVKLDKYWSDERYVSELFHYVEFGLYRLFYLEPRSKMYEKMKQDEAIAELSDKFLEKNTQISRNSKLGEILND